MAKKGEYAYCRGDSRVVRLPTWCYFGSHPVATDKNEGKLVMSGQRTPFDLLSWLNFQE